MEKKTKKVTFRLSKNEFEEISKRIPIGMDGKPIMKLSTFIRRAVLNKRVVAIDRELERYKAYSSFKINTNINLIAHWLDSDFEGRFIGQATYEQVLEELLKIRAEMRELLGPLR